MSTRITIKARKFAHKNGGGFELSERTIEFPLDHARDHGVLTEEVFEITHADGQKENVNGFVLYLDGIGYPLRDNPFNDKFVSKEIVRKSTECTKM